MKKLTTLLLAAAFSTPAFAGDVVDFGIGIDEGYKGGDSSFATTSTVLRSSGPDVRDGHVLDFGLGIDEGYASQRDYPAEEVLVTDERDSGGNRLDFGLGIDSGYEDCVC
ncbi:MAG: hypothetical protein U5S82_17350 [Gammaproteobacteria bacterium]|nr:hypothetical protein [Gammaproteobacteria bacterium]